MKWTSSFLLSLLVAGTANASPVGDFNGLQTILSGIVEHADGLAEWLNGATKDILDYVDESREVIKDGAKKLLKGAGEKAEIWTEDGLEYISQHGTICMSRQHDN